MVHPNHRALHQIHRRNQDQRTVPQIPKETYAVGSHQDCHINLLPLEGSGQQRGHRLRPFRESTNRLDWIVRQRHATQDQVFEDPIHFEH